MAMLLVIAVLALGATGALVDKHHSAHHISAAPHSTVAAGNPLSTLRFAQVFGDDEESEVKEAAVEETTAGEAGAGGEELPADGELPLEGGEEEAADDKVVPGLVPGPYVEQAGALVQGTLNANIPAEELLKGETGREISLLLQDMLNEAKLEGGDIDRTLGQFVPFGKEIPEKEGIEYYISSGAQECNICERIIKNGFTMGWHFHGLCTKSMAKQYKSMCYAQQKVLQSCPEFMNQWCYQDLGGTQALRSPCPTFLVCHYCLGLNPLHCVAGYNE